MAIPRTKTSGSAFTAVVYITIGAIMDVWSGLWYIYMTRHNPEGDGPYYWCYGFLLTGLTLIIIGLSLGQIGRQARHAEAPPDTNNANAPPPQASAPAVAPQGAVPLVAMQAPVAPLAPSTPTATTQPVAGNHGAYPRR